MDSKYRKLGKNILFLTVGNFTSRVLSFLLVPVYTAILSTEEYGVADLFTTTANLILPIFTLLIYESVMRFALDKEENKAEIFSIGLWITLAGGILISIFSLLFRNIELLQNHIILFLLYYITLALFNLILQFIKGIELVGIYSTAGVINTFIYIFCNILFLIFFKWGLEGYLLSFVIGHTIAFTYVFLVAKLYKYIISWRDIHIQKLKEMITYSLPMIPNAISWWISNSSNRYMLVYFYGTAINGIYSVAYKIPSILSILLTIFIGAWQISAVTQFGSEESKKFYSDIYRMYESTLIIGSAFLIAGTKVLAWFLYSAEFYQAWLYTPVLILASVFNSLAAFYGSIYTSAKRTSMLFYSTLIGAIANIVLNLGLIPYWGAMGASIATLVSYLMVWGIRVINSRKIMRIQIDYVKCSVGYICLIIECILICLDDDLYYPFIFICVGIICFVHRKVMIAIINRTLRKFCRN